MVVAGAEPGSELDSGSDFRGYKASEVSAPYQVLYFSLELYAVVRVMSIVPMELATLRVVSYCSV